ncbi:hypothetical protein ABPG75_012840 [Micractinium tetrahymenae]
MTEATEPSLALALALEVLGEAAPTTDEQLQAVLGAIQEACTALVALVERGGRLSSDLLENALEAVRRGLAGARARLEAAADQLAVVAGSWSTAALAAADICLHSEAWHAAFHAEAGGGKEAYLRGITLARDMLRDELLPLLGSAAAQLTADTGFLLAPQFRALLAMGRTAAEVVGKRDRRHHWLVRNFSVLNVLWNGIQNLWTAVPAEVRHGMESQGLGATPLVQLLLGFVRKDVRAWHQQLDLGFGKLLQYWVHKAKLVLAEYPEAAPACWQPLLDALVCSHRELGLLLQAAAAPDAAPGAAPLAEALRAQVIRKMAALLASCLGCTTAEDKLRVMLDALRMRLSSTGSEGSGEEAAHELRTVLHLLHNAPGMPVQARQHCVALLSSVLESLSGPPCAAALGSAELREQVAEAALAFLAACCHAASTAAGNPELDPRERQLAAQTWERCQQQLFLHALQPHPVTAHVLGCVWSDLAGTASEALLQSHAVVLRDLLRFAVAADAAAGPHVPPSPLCSQLLGLLACLLAAAPPAVLDAYYANFLQLLPTARDDACQLACLAAELRLAALVDTACGRPAAARQAEEVLGGLYAQLHEAGPLVAKRLAKEGAGDAGGEAEEDRAYLAWLLDALQCGVAYFASTRAQPAPQAAQVLAILPGRLALLLSHAAKHGALSFAGPLLAALRDLQSLAPLEQHDLQLLLPALTACLQRPELAAAAAQLVPALATCSTPHAEVVQAALAAPTPLLQHLGMEAFRLYARACPPENVGRAVPPAACNPDTGLPGEAFTALMQQYAARTPGPPPAEEEMAAWAAALRQEALGAAAALRRAAEAHRAAAEAAGAGRAAEPASRSGSEPPSPGAGSAGSGEQGAVARDAVAAAAEQLDSALSQLEAALEGAPLDAAAAGTLQRCAARLAQLLAAPAQA